MKSRKKKNVSVDSLTITRRITRSMSLKYGNDNSLPFPIDLIIIIFSKLPLKSIARCRCVSKLWASILRRPDFTDLFLSNSCSRSSKLLFAFHIQSEFFIFSSPQPQYQHENLSLVVPDYLMKFSFDGKCENGDLVHGLICLEEFRTLKICNPSTGQTLILPKVKTRIRSLWWSLLGYDPIGKQFKVLSMRKRGRADNTLICDEYQILTLGSGKMSWKMIECCTPHDPPNQKICINGVIYYTPLCETFLIVCFDVRFEKFSFIKTTGIINRADETIINLINYNGKLGLLLCDKDVKFALLVGRSIRFELWVLEELEKQEWSHHTFLFPSVPENIVGRVRFIGVTQTNEIVLSSSYNHHIFDLFYFNLEKKTVVRVEIKGIEAFVDEHNGIGNIFLDHVEDVKLY